MKKLLFLGLILLGFNSNCFANYWYENITDTYQTLPPGYSGNCVTEHKSPTDPLKDFAAMFHFDATKRWAAEVVTYLDGIQFRPTRYMAGAYWFKDQRDMEWGLEQVDIWDPCKATKITICVTNFSPESNMYLKGTFNT